MKTTTILSIVAIVAAVAAAGLVTAISLSKPAHAAACNFFPSTAKCNPGGIHPNSAFNENSHSKGGPKS